MKMEFSKMRSESSKCTWNVKATLIHSPEELPGRMCTGSLGEKSDES